MNKLKLGLWAALLMLVPLIACHPSTTSRDISITHRESTTTPSLVVEETPITIRTPTVNPSPIGVKTAIVTVRPSVSASPSSTFILPTSTQVYPDTYTYKGKVIPLCAGEGDLIHHPADFGIHGTIVYQIPNYGGLYTVGGTPLTKSLLPVKLDQNYFVFGFSQDGKWLAYTPVFYEPDGSTLVDNPSIMLLSNTGEIQEHILDLQKIKNTLIDEGVRLEGLGYPSYWINNDFIQTAFVVQNAGFGTGNAYELMEVLNPFRGEIQEDLLKKLPDRGNASAVGISPDMSRIIFDTVNGIVLRDLKDGRELWRDTEFISSSRMIILWAPDSSMAMVANLNEQPEDRQYFLIDRDGTTKRIIANSMFPYPGFYLYDLSWSSDSRYIVLVSYGDTFNLLVYDVLGDQYIFRCPVYGNVFAHWSPDNQQIAYSLYRGGSLQVLDLATGQVVELAEEGAFVGWSDKFPVLWP